MDATRRFGNRVYIFSIDMVMSQSWAALSMLKALIEGRDALVTFAIFDENPSSA